ncbi:hypothetical protein [Adhaeretor mobilis]|uniref:Uncharacterized protein n=1 Tax=Adhaeretor mobilis TaxID=1930276 RepID=A0A517MT91_9BACT|nr:hypothetical protein [Adhaeretor mobilis]QDS98072.1 hypothetical protein HG15A2_13440 [Adhaeretor mobilis]
MVNFINPKSDALLDAYEDVEHFERIRCNREGVMPVSRTRAAAKGRRRNKPPRRTHRAPQHCHGVKYRHNHRWMRGTE